MSLSSAGIGSGLDVASLVQQLVASERAPTAGRIDRSERQNKAQISALGSLRSAFDGLRTAIGKLTSGDAAQARKVTVQAEAGFTASATRGAAIGNFQVEVLRLSSAHKLSSAAHATADATVGTGQLVIASGDTTISIDISSANGSLAGIRDAINAAAGGKGIAATIVQADDGAHLVLSARESGAANALTISTSGGDGGLAGLAHAPPAASDMTQITAAQDARVRVDGFERSSPNDTISDMLEGVTLTLTKETTGTSKQLTVASDPSVLRGAAKGFVSAYNSAMATIAATTRYDETTQVAAALNGDALVRGTSRDLRSALSASVTDLKAIGITIEKDGKLKMDDAAFDLAISSDPTPATRLFTADAGLASTIASKLERLLEDDGLFDSRSDGLERRTKSIADQRVSLDRRMGQVEARYRAQFFALDGLMAKMQTTSSFLAQQLNLLQS